MNRLAQETSPYLRQHRDNPVDWYPWGDDAFEQARADDAPVFLSVGYSACHWCHVMAHESFEDPATAAVMNRLFVNVKVDREERPDVDAIYMQAVQAMTGRGGWPMSVWLTPDGRPFYGGTYFPKADGHGMPGFVAVCEAVAQAWRERRAEVLDQAGRLTSAIDEALGSLPERGELTPSLLDAAYAGLRAQFEPRFGGFGRAPKFPQAMTLELVGRAYARNQAPETLEMLATSLDGMAAGGIYDQIGGGFSRYSTDDFWLVPHFEKMLYDNALLLRAYLHAHLLTGEPRWRRIVEETVTYVLRDLRHPDGGFFSAEDADSEGEEGRFYVWDLAEIEAVCGDDAPEVVRYYGVTPGGNFEGRNILHVVDRTEPRPPAVGRARERLFERRARRVRPGLDDKVLLAWNALFLQALAEAAAALERPDWMEAARSNARFLLSSLRRGDGRLLRSWQADANDRPGVGRARHLAYAEDYGALLEALVTLAETDDVAWLAEARRVADDLVRLFHDPDGGGFFTTGHDAEPLVVRPKDLQDNAVPSANSLAANGLLRLAALTGDDSLAAPAREVLEMLAPVLGRHPTAFAHALGALDRLLAPPLEVAILGDPDDPRTIALRREVHRRVLPSAVRIGASPGTGADLTPLLAGRPLVDGKPTAYVCEHFACRQPVTDPAELRAQLDAALATGGAEAPVPG